MTKALVDFGGIPLISRVINAIGGLFPEIIIVTNQPGEFKDFGNFRIVSDQFNGAGPLGGIHAALSAAGGNHVFVFAGDMPFINREIVTRVASLFIESDFEILVSKSGDNIEPLHSIYGKSVLPVLESYLVSHENPAVRDFIIHCKTGFMQMDDIENAAMSFSNINTPEELAKLRKQSGF